MNTSFYKASKWKKKEIFSLSDAIDIGQGYRS
jgi:hypothetical protein